MRINPLGLFLLVEYVYIDNNTYDKVEPLDNFLAIDLGVNNLLSMIDNVNNKQSLLMKRD